MAEDFGQTCGREGDAGATCERVTDEGAVGTGIPRGSVFRLTPRELGSKGEEMAASYLDRKGWCLLERNWRCLYGEVDIVAQDDDDGCAVVLVEVKTRLAAGPRAEGMPELAVDERKRRRYRTLALAYLASHPEVDSLRFDVIALSVIGEGEARLRHLVGAFSWDD